MLCSTAFGIWAKEIWINAVKHSKINVEITDRNSRFHEDRRREGHTLLTGCNETAFKHVPLRCMNRPTHHIRSFALKSPQLCCCKAEL